MKHSLILIATVFSLVKLYGQESLAFVKVFDMDKMNAIYITIDSDNWRWELDATGELVEAHLKINNASIDGRIARKGNSANINTRGRDKFPMKFDGPGSFNFKLNNNYRDYTMGAREYIGYRLHKEFTGIGSDVAVADIYINDEYYGRFNVVEDLNKGFFKEKVGMISERIKSTSTTEGLLNNKKNSNLNWLGEDPDLYKGIYEVKQGELEPLIELIDMINNDAERAAQDLDIEEIIKFLVVENYLMNTDGIIGRLFSHNYELIKRESDNKWQLVPWDLNLILGAHSKSLYEQEEIPIESIIKIPPTLGKDNNALIRMIVEEYGFLFHYTYTELLWKYPADKLIKWANKFKAIIASSNEKDSKLYDEDIWARAFYNNVVTVDGFVPGLIPIIQARYQYLKELKFDQHYYNRIKSVELKDDIIIINTTPGINRSQLAIEYNNHKGQSKKLRPSIDEGNVDTYTCHLPMDVMSFFVSVQDLGVQFTFPILGKLDPIIVGKH